MFQCESPSSLLIYFFKGQGRVADRLLSLSPADIAVPAIVLDELEVGIAKSTSPRKRRHQLKVLADVTRVLPFDRSDAEAAARIRLTLEELGAPVGPYDLPIAGTALAHDATLVTRTSRELGQIGKLQIEDWSYAEIRAARSLPRPPGEGWGEGTIRGETTFHRPGWLGSAHDR